MICEISASFCLYVIFISPYFSHDVLSISRIILTVVGRVLILVSTKKTTPRWSSQHLMRVGGRLINVRIYEVPSIADYPRNHFRQLILFLMLCKYVKQVNYDMYIVGDCWLCNQAPPLVWSPLEVPFDRPYQIIGRL